MPTPENNAARKTGLARLTRVLAALAGLVVMLPAPSYARLGALHSRRAPQLERATTGGLVTLRAPGSSMIRVARSKFLMGSNSDDVTGAVARCALEALGHRCSERTFSNELPKIAVSVESYWLDRTEVTVEAYERCVEVGACPARRLVGGERRLASPTLPVTLVNAYEAEAFCRYRGARLPSEAEFERAARGTRGRTYPWGNLYNSRLANHGRLGLESVDASDGFEELAPVGSFVSGRTPDGFLDLAGNAAEWTADVYAERHGLPPEPGRSGERVVKGGHFEQPAPWLRGAARDALDAGERSPFVGFRCARSAEPAPGTP
ncbi:MAG TPA: SUMF1/EgtB/PvdO family nonheme iron enzyme [Polyangiaceae bacterium]|nr:SUMF1/EgtB/PvdO family nonheme iron enzyme [Polyangiaceae bacterium]